MFMQGFGIIFLQWDFDYLNLKNFYFQGNIRKFINEKLENWKQIFLVVLITMKINKMVRFIYFIIMMFFMIIIGNIIMIGVKYNLKDIDFLNFLFFFC